MENPRVKLKVLRKKNPQDRQEPGKYYVHAVKSANVNLDWLARLISNQSTVRKPDCLAVLSACVDNMIDELSRGSVVSLGSLGSFQVSVRSVGSDRPEQVSLNNVKSSHLIFRPSPEVKAALKSMKFTLSDAD